MSTPSEPKRLFVFDFDDTIANVHFHKILETKYIAQLRAKKETKITNQKAADQYTLEDGKAILDQYGIKHEEELAKIFFDILENGDHISVVSSSLYPKIIEQTLDKLWETPPLSQKPELRSLIHYTPVTFNKEWPPKRDRQVQGEMQHYNITNPANVCLIDDDENNIKLAETNLQCKTIQVPLGVNPMDTTYLREIEAFRLRTAEKEPEDHASTGYGSDSEFTEQSFPESPPVGFSRTMSSLNSSGSTSLSSLSSSEPSSPSSERRPRSGSSGSRSS